MERNGPEKRMSGSGAGAGLTHSAAISNFQIQICESLSFPLFNVHCFLCRLTVEYFLCRIGIGL